MLENQKILQLFLFFVASGFQNSTILLFFSRARFPPLSNVAVKTWSVTLLKTVQEATYTKDLYAVNKYYSAKIPVIFSCVIGGVVEVKGNKIFPFPNWVVKSEFMPQKSYPVAIAYSSSFSLFCLFKYLCIRISLFLNFSFSLSLLSLFYSLFVARMYLLLFHAYKQRPKLETRIFFCKIYFWKIDLFLIRGSFSR